MGLRFIEKPSNQPEIKAYFVNGDDGFIGIVAKISIHSTVKQFEPKTNVISLNELNEITTFMETL